MPSEAITCREISDWTSKTSFTSLSKESAQTWTPSTRMSCGRIRTRGRPSDRGAHCTVPTST